VQAGIEPEYTDTWGRTHTPSEETTRLILASLGTSIEPARSPIDPTPIDQTMVVREDAASIPLRVPVAPAGNSLKLEIQWEGGQIEHHLYSLLELPDGSDGEKRLPLPAPLRLGYHRLRLYWMAQSEPALFAESHFIVCPHRALSFEGRAAGVALSLYGLRSQRDWGCGDITDLHAAIDVFARAGAAFVALNPLHAIPNRQPYNTSPYLPQSSLYRNFLYLDVEKTPGYLPEPSLAGEIAELRSAEFVEYERVAHLKLAALEDAFDRFLDQGSSPEFDAYVEAEGAPLDRFAVYSALDEEIHRRDSTVWLWTDWPEEYHDPDSPAVTEFAREHRTRVEFFKFLQWNLDRQLAAAHAHALAQGMKIGLYHDLALATDRFGADLWANRKFYISGCRVGAPPDDFSPNGQDFLRRIATRIAPTATVCSRRPFATACVTAAHSASITSCDSFGCTGFRTDTQRPTARTSATTRRICWACWRWRARATDS
jgi:hypothetical protein